MRSFCFTKNKGEFFYLLITTHKCIHQKEHPLKELMFSINQAHRGRLISTNIRTRSAQQSLAALWLQASRGSGGVRRVNVLHHKKIMNWMQNRFTAMEHQNRFTTKLGLAHTT